ncbi:MAG TPA: proton-conducting transporter membrane subunit [Candidatus Binataceae bacterium]|nr:proton-conducting transporter membrane subunit [Candidatus Binataceae bacterium]
MAMQLLLVISLALCGVGVVLPLIINERRIPSLLGILGVAISGGLLFFSGAALFGGAAFRATLWTIPPLVTLTLELDKLSALFLFVSGLVLLPASIFASGHLDAYLNRYSLRAFCVSYFSLFATLILIPLSADVVSFLMLWELMSILLYLIVGYEHEVEEHARSAYVMFAIGEAGTLLIAFAFIVLAANGSLEFAALKAAGGSLGDGARWAVFLLAFIGFSVKAGLIPVNFWLPRAYTSAPLPFVPVLAGATLNLGLYGIVRLDGDLLRVTAPGPGLVVLIIGSVTALLGILYATTQSDLKTLLAHSSIENAGIIATALGAGFVFVGSGHPSIAAIAFAAAFYHMLNHSIYKSLLFVATGAVDSNVGTRNIDRLGGLIKAMPLTAGFFLIGALSIAALPPFNGFVSEWLTLQTMLLSAGMASTGIKIVFAICGAILALTAALAVTCFVKAFAMSFLGMPRSESAGNARRANSSAILPMAFLGVLCFVLGVAPTYVIPVLDGAIGPLAQQARAADALIPPFFVGNPHHRELPASFVADFHTLGAQLGQSVLPGRGLVVMHRGGANNPVVFAMSTSYMAAVLPLMLLGVFVVFRLIVVRGRAVERRAVWDGGIRRLLPEMTYTGTGFSNPVRVIFEAVFRPTTVEDTRETVGKHFRAVIRRTRGENHVLDRLLLNPISDAALWVANGFARMHHGVLNAYVFYGLGALIAALLVARFS